MQNLINCHLKCRKEFLAGGKVLPLSFRADLYKSLLNKPENVAGFLLCRNDKKGFGMIKGAYQPNEKLVFFPAIKWH